MAYLRFHRRFSLGRWLRLNISKKSVSLTAGPLKGGPHVTASTNGSVTASVGLPGTGLSVVHRTKRQKVRGWLDRLRLAGRNVRT